MLTYFKGANGEDFRYEQMPWGTAFVQYVGRPTQAPVRPNQRRGAGCRGRRHPGLALLR